MNRLSLDEIFMGQALIAAGGSTCIRRAVGCVLVDRYNHIIGVGRNGVPRGVAHCIDSPCIGAESKSGEGLDLCLATHAEINAVAQCSDSMAIEAAYCTTSPCIQCIKLLMNTSCKRIYFLDEYPQPQVRELWISTETYKKSWIQLDETPFLANIKRLVSGVRG